MVLFTFGVCPVKPANKKLAKPPDVRCPAAAASPPLPPDKTLNNPNIAALAASSAAIDLTADVIIFSTF